MADLATEALRLSMLSPTSIETYFRSATARLYETLDVPPFYLVLHPTDPAPWFNYVRPQTNRGSASFSAMSVCISASDGLAWNRLAAASTFGSTWMSPMVFRKMPGRPSTQ